MVQILQVRVADPGTHESNVTAVKWYNPESGAENVATVQAMVDFLRNGRAYVCNGSEIGEVEIATTPTVHIRVKPTEKIRSLLSLPRF